MGRNTAIIDHPSWFVYTEDLSRLREYANLHRLGDSATAIRKLLDDALGKPDDG